MSIPASLDTWRSNHVGHWLRLALERFDARVLELMARHTAAPLSLANLAARGQVGAAHIHITRHLELQGSRLTDLATRAGMTKQAMTTLVNQCEAWGMVERTDDTSDARAKHIRFTATGLAWLQAYQDAVAQAQDELQQAVGPEVATVIHLGLEAYCGH
ncbi:MarR family winged helix-turn-helix transcriptional regulator [Rhodoferax sp. TBRC 17198]|uniref:MarR family winged helix-turn-helix transcriptional regulator n=1 Tax=Rhodoferax potami TaxID=3068338 RepID=UPI0028BD2E79|nr:MarR family winged helix-turn-helix transcriptional regulator [Rhodoferax sp. TBRC 17198]MDT7524104.1 MarR family winged helix-turn-helix transcriptional regulator [Rhodoferax sp. TBRC 17198]